MAISCKGAHFPPEVILMGVRWYLAYPLSTRHVEERMRERGVHVDHSTVNRWVITYSPHLEEAFHRRKRPVWVSWRLDETYIKVKGQWRALYRAVDKYGQTIDFLLTEHRDKDAALRFLKKAIRRNGVPETMTIDGSDAHAAAIKCDNGEHGTTIVIRQVQYLNNVVEQDHRTVKKRVWLAKGYGSFTTAWRTLQGIEAVNMIRKGRVRWVAKDDAFAGLPHPPMSGRRQPRGRGRRRATRIATTGFRYPAPRQGAPAKGTPTCIRMGRSLARQWQSR